MGLVQITQFTETLHVDNNKDELGLVQNSYGLG